MMAGRATTGCNACPICSSESFSNSLDTGSAYDYYIDTDNGTITVSDTVTTSFDSFTLIPGTPY
jgi:hypothetical protein